MSHYHIDCAAGLAGDMFLAACLELGLPLEALEEMIPALGIQGVALEAWQERRGGVRGTRFRVRAEGSGQPGRRLTVILELIAGSGLPAPVRERAEELFRRLGEAEAAVHGVALEEVHFHEVGAVDSIVDLVGAALAVHHLEVASLTSGPVNVGGGRVETEHGTLPVPAPATARLLEGVPVFGGPWGELVTPTGAVLLKVLVDRHQGLPAMVLGKVGHGLGSREVEGLPNLCRLFRGELQEPVHVVEVLECQVDDLPGEGFGYLLEQLLETGALDAYFTPVQMKKSRPGTLVTVLCRPHERERLAALLLSESGSLGCRYHGVGRLEAERSQGRAETPWGAVRTKRATLGGRLLGEAPEYEDCRRLAREAGVPWRRVYAAALAALT